MAAYGFKSLFGLSVDAARSEAQPNADEERALAEIRSLVGRLRPVVRLVAAREANNLAVDQDALFQLRERRLLASFSTFINNDYTALINLWNFIMSDRNPDAFGLTHGGWHGYTLTSNNTTNYQRPFLHKLDNEIYRVGGSAAPERNWTGIN